MKSLIIVGAGEYGHLVKELAEQLGYQKIGFLDDRSNEALGTIDDYKSFTDEYSEFIIAIGNPDIRKQIYEQLSTVYKPALLISSMAYVSSSAMIEPGCIIEPMAVIHTAVKIGHSCIINVGAVINHNSVVSDYCQTDCNSVVATDSYVPESTKIGNGQVWIR